MLLREMDVPVPRYTSYPTAVAWEELDGLVGSQALQRAGERLSLYIHVPFCKSMCLYCGCSVVLNRNPANEERYVEYLEREIELVARALGERRKVAQLHFGGGTPTQLSGAQFVRLFAAIRRSFDVEGGCEIAVEIDPRTVQEGDKLEQLRALGCNRVSFGVQDLDPRVQEAVRRRQSAAMTMATFRKARELGFESINVDLIYGLPYQTVASFAATIEAIIAMRPERIALFSYAQVPWLKPHQKAIPQATLPSSEEKFAIFRRARDLLLKDGYVTVGMDHYALESDELAIASRSGTLRRTFQGYTVCAPDEVVGLGLTAIGYVGGAYIQNAKELPAYYDCLDRDTLPTQRGKVLSADDLMRRWVIGQLMCLGRVDKSAFQHCFEASFDEVFAAERQRLDQRLARDGEELLEATAEGAPFVRHIAALFDQYLGRGGFSRGV